MTVRNPKQDGSNVFDCKPQCGPCPLDCNQCFYNRPGAFYVPIDQPHFPTIEEVGNGIVRVNCGHDSNIDRDKVVAETAQYKERFFNTSIPKFDFPGPVVLTANPREEEDAFRLPSKGGWVGPPANIMFARLRVSATNLHLIENAVENWTDWGVPVVLTFMAYYDAEPDVPAYVAEAVGKPCYEWKVRHINSYWCPTPAFMRYVIGLFNKDRLVTMCGTYTSPYCRDCRNCETHYWQTKKRMAEKGKVV